MKRRILIIVMLLCTLILFTGCEKKNKVKSTLYKVLTNEKSFSYGGKEYKLDEYVKGNPYKIDTVAYAYVDMDNNQNEELVLYLEGIDAEYMVLSLEDNVIYAYRFSIKSMQDIRESGVFKGVTSDESYAYLNAKLNHGNVEENVLASKDKDKYVVDHQNVSKEAFDEYENKVNSTNKVKFEKYK